MRSEKEQILRVKPPLGGIDLNNSPTVVEPNIATGIKNIRVLPDSITTRPGSRKLGDSLEEPVVQLERFVTLEGIPITIVYTTDNIYTYDHKEGEWTSVINSEWSVDVGDTIDTTNIKDKLITCSLTNPILEWDGDAVYFTAINDPEEYRFRTLSSFNFRTVYGYEIDVDAGEEIKQRIRWTEVGTYNKFHSGRANFVDLIDSPGEIQRLEKLSNELVIYKSDSIIICQHTGGVNVFSFQTRVTDFGLITPSGVVNMGDYHIFLGEDNVYLFSGGRDPEPIGDPVKGELLNLMYAEYSDNIVSGSVRDSAWFAVPVGHEYPEKIFVFDTRLQQWSVYNLEVTAIGTYQEVDMLLIEDAEGTIGDFGGRIGDYGSVDATYTPVIGNTEGEVRKISTVYNTDDGEPITGEWTSKEFTLSQGYMTRYNRLRAIELEARGEEIEILYSLNDGVSWSSIKTVSLTDDYRLHRAYFDTSARSIRLKFRGDNFNLRSFSILFREGAIR